MGLDQAAAPEVLGLEARVRTAKLTPAQRQIARLLLEKSEHFMFLSAADVAAEAGVSQPSVSRLARALDYGSYGEMMVAVRERVQVGHGARPPADEAGNRYQKAIDDEVALLHNLRRSLAEGQAIERAGQLLNSADIVMVVGLRISASLAQNFAYRLGRIRPNVRLSITDGSQVYDDLALAADAPTKALLVFAMPRYPRELVRLMRYAKKRGYSVVVVTDNHASEFAGLADEALIAEINWGLTFGTHTAATVISALLAEEVGGLRPELMRRRLGDLDEVASEMDHYLTD